MEFSNFKKAIQDHFAQMSETTDHVYEVEVDKDEMWNLYLDSFPAGTNEIYRKRREYDCSCCRQFIRVIGNVVFIKDAVVHTIWELTDLGTTFQPVADALDAYIKARAGMMSLTNSKGRALNLIPEKLVVPPALEKEARDILVADFVNGTKNTMQGTAEIHVEPRLKSDTAWFLLCTKRPIKPLIYQQRKKAKFVSKTQETDENVFMKKQFLYGADSRGNAGFGFWQMAFGSDGTAAN